MKCVISTKNVGHSYLKETGYNYNLQIAKTTQILN